MNRTQADKSSKYQGVSKTKRNKYIAYLTVNHERKYLGQYDTEEEAAEAVAKFAEVAGLRKPLTSDAVASPANAIYFCKPEQGSHEIYSVIAIMPTVCWGLLPSTPGILSFSSYGGTGSQVVRRARMELDPRYGKPCDVMMVITRHLHKETAALNAAS